MASITLLAVPPIAPKFLWTSTRHPPRIPTVLLLAPTSTCAPRLGLVQCTAVVTKPSDQSPVRRSGNYKPPIWTDDFVQSLKSDYEGTKYTGRVNELKRHVKMMLEEAKEPLDQLELVDNLQRLGVSYHFEDLIKRVLENIYNNNGSDDKWYKEDLYATALRFRLLRQHGYNVPQEIFNSFRNEEGNLKPNLCEDTKGMLYLYEASYLAIEGESILEWAREFTAKNLKEKLEEQKMDQNLAILVHHSLEVPLHWRVPRLESRWFINWYERRPEMNPMLLELAKLDFNIVQATHQSDLRYVSKWWRGTCLGEKLTFARDRLMENFLWTVGVIFEPQHKYCRRMLATINAFITTIDDVYDVYGTLEELQLFTDAVERWDINAMEQLPEYMQICFLALFNSINEMAYDAVKEQDVLIVSYLKKADEMKRGDVPKSIQCYINQTGVSEEDAREYIRSLINETWKKMNKDRVAESPFSHTFIGMAINIARMSQCMYQHGDGHASQSSETKDRVLALLIEPIPLV